jgi:hypothetical protein
MPEADIIPMDTGTLQYMMQMETSKQMKTNGLTRRRLKPENSGILLYVKHTIMASRGFCSMT